MVECEQLNPIWLHQQVFYESDVFDAGGSYLDKQYLYKWPRDEKWSTYNFGLQSIQTNHMALRREALNQLAPGVSHKHWPWCWNPQLMMHEEDGD
jgi:hypothetical protein